MRVCWKLIHSSLRLFSILSTSGGIATCRAETREAQVNTCRSGDFEMLAKQRIKDMTLKQSDLDCPSLTHSSRCRSHLVLLHDGELVVKRLELGLDVRLIIVQSLPQRQTLAQLVQGRRWLRNPGNDNQEQGALETCSFKTQRTNDDESNSNADKARTSDTHLAAFWLRNSCSSVSLAVAMSRSSDVNLFCHSWQCDRMENLSGAQSSSTN